MTNKDDATTQVFFKDNIASFRFSVIYMELCQLRKIFEKYGRGYFENRTRSMLRRIPGHFKDVGIVDVSLNNFIELNEDDIVRHMCDSLTDIVGGKYKLIISIPEVWNKPNPDEPNSIVSLTLCISVIYDVRHKLVHLNERQRVQLNANRTAGHVLITGQQTDDENDDGRNFVLKTIGLEEVINNGKVN